MKNVSVFYDHILSISEQEHISVVEALQEARRLGVEYLDIAQFRLLGKVDEIEAQLAQSGMKGICIPGHFNFDESADIMEQFRSTADAAQRLGIKRIMPVPGFWKEGADDGEKENHTRRMIVYFKSFAQEAYKRNISLELEDFDNFRSPISTIAGVKRFLDEVPGLNCCFDTGNFRLMNDDVREAFNMFRDKIVHIHLKDRSYTPTEGKMTRAIDGQELYPCPVGDGSMRIAEILAELKKDGFEGPYSIELYGFDHILDGLRRSVENLSQIL